MATIMEAIVPLPIAPLNTSFFLFVWVHNLVMIPLRRVMIIFGYRMMFNINYTLIAFF
jgi:hypothetical protein